MKTSKKIKRIQGSKKRGRKLAYLARQRTKEMERKAREVWNDTEKLENFLLATGVLK